MKPELKISIADLGKLFAEYCMSQGIIEDFDDNEVSLTEKGIEALQGAPYYFDLEIGRDEGAIAEDYLESETTFTWYQISARQAKTTMSDEPGQRRSMEASGFSTGGWYLIATARNATTTRQAPTNRWPAKTKILQETGWQHQGQ